MPIDSKYMSILMKDMHAASTSDLIFEILYGACEDLHSKSVEVIREYLSF